MIHVRILCMAFVTMGNVVPVCLTTQGACLEANSNDQASLLHERPHVDESDEVSLLQSHLQNHKRRGASKDSAPQDRYVERRRLEALHTLFGLPPELTPRVSAVLENIVQKLSVNHSSGTAIPEDALPALMDIASPAIFTSHSQEALLTHRSASKKPLKKKEKLWFNEWGIPWIDHFMLFKGMIVFAAILGLVVLCDISFLAIIGRGAPSQGADDDDLIGVPAEGYVEPDIYDTFSARKRQHLFLSVPQSTLGATVWSVFINLTIFASLVTMFLDSFRKVQEDCANAIATCEWFYLFVFCGEWIGRLMCCSSISEHLSRIMTWIDFWAALPSLLECVFSDDDIGKEYNLAKLLRILRILRLFRLFKLLSKSKRMHIIVNGIMASVPAFIGSLSIIAFAIVVPGVTMYFIEQGEWDENLKCYRRTYPSGELEDGCSPFQNMGASFYWAVTTISTVGYGDITPITSLGKCCCSVIMVFCIILMAFPIAMITSAFTLALDEYEFENADGSKIMESQMLGLAKRSHGSPRISEDHLKSPRA